MENKNMEQQNVNFFYIKEQGLKGERKEYYISSTENLLKDYKPEHHLCGACAMDIFMDCDKVLDGVASSSIKCFNYNYDFIKSMGHHIEIKKRSLLKDNDFNIVIKDIDRRMSKEENKLGIYDLGKIQDFIDDNCSSDSKVMVKASRLFDVIIDSYQSDEFYPYIPKECILTSLNTYNEYTVFDSHKFVVLKCDNFERETRINDQKLFRK